MEIFQENNIVLIVGTLLVLLLVVFMIFFVVLYGKAQLKLSMERQQFQQELLQAEIEIQTQTLQNVSQELHDNLGQVAALLKMNLTQVEATAESEGQLKQSKTLIQQLITDIKGISASLQRHPLNETRLDEAIQIDGKRINQAGFINIKLNCSAIKENLDHNTSIFLYRMYQEAINNSISHAQANNLIISLQQSQKQIELTVEDDGIGFNPKEAKSGNGLLNLQKRATAIGADFKVESKINQGTRLRIKVPLKPKHA
ncbi:MAG: sensor histidine kinase [Vicingaceae bacterium]